MGGKREHTDQEEKIRRKIRRLEDKLRKKKIYKKIIIETSEDDSDDPSVLDTQEQRAHPATPCSSPPRPPYSPLTVASLASSPDPEPSTSRAVQSTSAHAANEPAPVPKEPMPSTSNIEGSTNKVDSDLQDEILLLLGEAPKNDIVLGRPIHKDIAGRWQEILAKGLSKEIKSKILEEYPIPSKCNLLLAPLLNPEAKAAIPETHVKRDFSLMIKQKQVGIAISALAQAIELVINNETSAQKILKPISDACRLLCDTHFNDTKTRRNFVTSTTNLNFKDALVESARDKYLFGETLSEKLKAAKTIQQSGESLKTKKQSGFFNKNSFLTKSNNNHLNSQAFHRKTRNKPAEQERTRPPRTYSNQQRRTRYRESPRRTADAAQSRTTRSSHRK